MSLPARMPETIATIIAVSTEAMILFHSKDDIDVPPTLSVGSKSKSPRQLDRIITLPASGRTGHLVAAGSPKRPNRDPREPDHPHPCAARLDPIIGKPLALMCRSTPLADLALPNSWSKALMRRTRRIGKGCCACPRT